MLGYEEQEISNHLDEWSSRVHPDDLGWVRRVIQDHFDKKLLFISVNTALDVKTALTNGFWIGVKPCGMKMVTLCGW